MEEKRVVVRWHHHCGWSSNPHRSIRTNAEHFSAVLIFTFASEKIYFYWSCKQIQKPEWNILQLKPENFFPTIIIIQNFTCFTRVILHVKSLHIFSRSISRKKNNRTQNVCTVLQNRKTILHEKLTILILTIKLL